MTRIRRFSGAIKYDPAATECSTSQERSALHLSALPMALLAWTPPTVERRPLETQHLGLAALDAGYCCHESTQLHLLVERRFDRFVVGSAVENATGHTLFEVREKHISLHRQRTLVDTTEVPVATMRMSAFHRRKVTYTSFLRADMSAKPQFKFVVVSGKVEMTFDDIMTGETCRLGSENEQGNIEIWVQRGVSKATARRRPIAHMYNAPPGSPMGHSLDIAKGVDAVLVILVCIAMLDTEPERVGRAPSSVGL